MAVARKPAAKPVAVTAPAAPEPKKELKTPAAPVVETVVAEKMLGSAREAQEQFRKAVEDGIAKSREAYEKMRTAAEEATGSLEASYAAATKGVNEFNARAIDAFKTNSEASLDHMKSVMAAKSIGDAIALQSTHARKQFETFAAQTRELSTLAQKIAAASVEPLKSSIGKTFAH